MKHLTLVGFANVYSNPIQGLEIFGSLRNPILIDIPIVSFPQITVPTFLPNDYFRYVFPVAQPPLFLLDLSITNGLKEILNIKSDYIILNLTNIIFSISLTFLVSRVLKGRSVKNYQTWSLALIWANPLMILQSNVQGYRDLLLLNLITLSISLICNMNRHHYLSGAVFGLACFTKPTAVFVSIVIFICLSNRELLKFIAGMIMTASVVIGLYFYTSRLYGLLAALFTEFSFTKTFSEGISFWSSFKLLYEYSDYLPISTNLQHLTYVITRQLYNNLTLISVLHLIVFFLIALKLRQELKVDFFSREIQLLVASFYFLIPNSRMNHYFVFITILLVAIPLAKEKIYFVAILVLLLLQDLIYGGFGRNSFFEGTNLSLPINSVLSTLIIVFLFSKIKKNRILFLLPTQKRTKVQ
jgi:hypothetical protein